jgi:hypothetical protein
MLKGSWRKIFFIHLFTCAYIVWAISHPYPHPHPHFHAEPVMPLLEKIVKSKEIRTFGI